MLRRPGDDEGVRNYVEHLERGTLDADGVLDEMLTSMELRSIPYRNSLRSLHQSRCDWIRMLPRARRILDLGGTDLDDPAGSLVSMGYPYAFEQLVIVDLPHGERHSLYERSERVTRVDTPLGPVRYEYHSMDDLGRYPDGHFDLVVSGESIEHVAERAADDLLRGAWRVLRAGGWLCLDTPNRRATIHQTGSDRFTNPDHEIEYTHPQLATKLAAAGFEIVGAFGLSYVGESIARREFSDAELARNHGVFHELEDCYLLAYTCRKPA
jgi:SAM-dependent methyltransferase